MKGPAVLIFLISLAFFVTASVIFLYNMGQVPSPAPSSMTGIPNPNSSWIGAQCPVSCTCFPNPDATLPSDKPTQMCAFLSNDTMFKCPAECCQPSCINQDVPDFAIRS